MNQCNSYVTSSGMLFNMLPSFSQPAIAPVVVGYGPQAAPLIEPTNSAMTMMPYSPNFKQEPSLTQTTMVQFSNYPSTPAPWTGMSYAMPVPLANSQGQGYPYVAMNPPVPNDMNQIQQSLLKLIKLEEEIEKLLLLHGVGAGTVDSICTNGITLELVKGRKFFSTSLEDFQQWVRCQLRGNTGCYPKVNEIAMGVSVLLAIDLLQCNDHVGALKQLLDAYSCMLNMQQTKIAERKRKQNAPYPQQALA